MNLFFHESGKINEKLVIIAAYHFIGESSRPDAVMDSR
jgi:hypothetical protein